MILSIVVVVYPSLSMSYTPRYAILFTCFRGSLSPFIFSHFFRFFFSSKHILHTSFQHTTSSLVWTHKEWLFFFPPPLLHLFNAFLHRFYFFDIELCDVIVSPLIFLNTSWWRFVLSLLVLYAAYFLSLPYFFVLVTNLRACVFAGYNIRICIKKNVQPSKDYRCSSSNIFDLCSLRYI